MRRLDGEGRRLYSACRPSVEDPSVDRRSRHDVPSAPRKLPTNQHDDPAWTAAREGRIEALAARVLADHHRLGKGVLPLGTAEYVEVVCRACQSRRWAVVGPGRRESWRCENCTNHGRHHAED